MRIDIVSIFPGYLAPLELSLIGRARRRGVLDVVIHDLRDWAEDRRRTVDDTPCGGGAGMVMRPDVWGRALDDVLDLHGRAGAPGILLVPTPAGELLSQRMAEELARDLERGAPLVIACGRYEGIDARVTAHYAGRGVAVREVSIGDYVLNGGEAAALVIVETVARLLPGVVGNPASLVEESHAVAGILEGPVFTRPLTWRHLDVPEVLLTGDHAKIARWRRDRGLRRTSERRPDLLEALDLETLDGDSLDRADRATLAALGWVVVGSRLRRVVVRTARPDDAPDLARLARDTFPFACPPGTDPSDVADYVSSHLSAERFTAYLGDPGRYVILVAAEPGEAATLLGYTMAVLPRAAADPPEAAEVAAQVVARPVAELSKCYVRSDLRGSGLADALVTAAHADLAERRVDGRAITAVWLGTNRYNRRARRFYRRRGYVDVGRRSFHVGSHVHDDVVMVCRLGSAVEG